MFSNHFGDDLQCRWPYNINLTFLNNAFNLTDFEYVSNHYEKNHLDGDEYSLQRLKYVSGIFMVFLVAIGFDNFKEFFKASSNDVKETFVGLRTVISWILFQFIVVLLILFVLIIILFFYCYRQFVKNVLRFKYGDDFVELLKGTDPIWAIENDVSYDIINILAFVELHPDRSNKLLTSIRKTFLENFLAKPKQYAKILYNRKLELGYAFWHKNDKFVIEDHIRSMNPINNETNISESELSTIIGNYCNTKLPNDHRSSWEILVGTQSLEDYSFTSDTENLKIPILIRIHHSIGDGVSLLKMLLDLMNDNKDDDVFDYLSAQKLQDKIMKYKMTKKNKSIFFMNKFWSYYTELVESVRQLVFGRDDANILHGSTLSGDKVVAWICDEEHQSLIGTIKNIKQRYTEITFMDVLLTGVSIGLYNYFKNKSATIPKHIKVVLPVRMPESLLENGIVDIKTELSEKDEQCGPNNKFSVAMLDLPIFNRNGFTKKIQLIHQANEQLKDSSDYIFNYAVMKLLSASLPLQLIGMALKSTQSTLVMSNMPGPSKNITICDGYNITNLMFWIPNRDTTGIGISVLSYKGCLHIGILADKGLISNSEEAKYLLKNIVNSLKELDSS